MDWPPPSVPSTDLTFDSRDAHRAWLRAQAALPAGFRAGTTSFDFVARETGKRVRMNLALLALERPTADFAAVFTRNAVAGAPVAIGRRRLDGPALGAIAINNKVANVGAQDGERDAERVCEAVATALGLDAQAVLPSSTGVIGWKLPVDAMLAAVPAAVSALDARSIFAAAEAIMTTDLYPKVRRADVAGGALVGFAKGAGMIEPSMATMLAYLCTDLAVPRAALRAMLGRAVDATFNRMSVDGDTSTSDTVVALSSGIRPCPDLAAFERALTAVCADLAEDIVRNGEGVHHVIRVSVRGAASEAMAADLGKAVANSLLVKCAVCGNDPNVGRLVAAVGQRLGIAYSGAHARGLRVAVGGRLIYDAGLFRLDPDTETAVAAHLRDAELYASAPAPDGAFRPPHDYPAHERAVDIAVELGLGAAAATILGADLSHEYVSENADYRS